MLNLPNSAGTECAKQAPEQPAYQLKNEELRNALGGADGSRCDGSRVVNRRHGFVMRDFLLFVGFCFEVSNPKSREIKAARVAHAAVILHVLAFWAFEEQRSVARRAELHAL